MKTLPEHGFFIRATGILLLILVTPLQASDKTRDTVGLAYDLQSDELLYRETHCLNSDGSEREVVYQNLDGKLIARKLVDYSSGAITPSFVQHNHYSSESIRVDMKPDGVRMSIVDRDNDDASRSTVAEPGNSLPVVIDAGFDSFVRLHWDALVGGEKREFQFPFAERESLVELRIQPQACSYASESDQCFRLDLANWFLRMMVKPIELGYDAESRRLTRFRGLSNIGDANGNGLVVDIRYDYTDSAAAICELPTPIYNVNLPGPVGRS